MFAIQPLVTPIAKQIIKFLYIQTNVGLYKPLKVSVNTGRRKNFHRPNLWQKNTFVWNFSYIRSIYVRQRTNAQFLIYYKFLKQMACKLQFISCKVQSFRANKVLFKEILEKCGVILLQKVLLSETILKELDNTMQYYAISGYTHVYLNIARPAGGLDFIWITKNAIYCFPNTYADRIMSLLFWTPIFVMNYVTNSVHMNICLS